MHFRFYTTFILHNVVVLNKINNLKILFAIFGIFFIKKRRFGQLHCPSSPTKSSKNNVADEAGMKLYITFDPPYCF